VKTFEIEIVFRNYNTSARITKYVTADFKEPAEVFAKDLMQTLINAKGFVECDEGMFQPLKYRSVTYNVYEKD
jgi:hypothetical protein